MPLPLPLPLPWSVPEGAASGQQWAASSHPSLRSLCMQWFSTGACSKGERCHLVHGELCQVRGAAALLTILCRSWSPCCDKLFWLCTMEG